MDSNLDVISKIKEIGLQQIDLDAELNQLDMETEQLEAEIQAQELEIRQNELTQVESTHNNEGNVFKDRLNERENELKGRLQTLVNQINGSETESFELVSILSNELIANYSIFIPNTAKAQLLLGLKLVFDTRNFQITAASNLSNQRYLTHSELALTFADLTRTYQFRSKSLFFHSLSLHAVQIA